MKCEDNDINEMVNMNVADDKIIELSSQQTPKMETKIYNVTTKEDGVTWGKCHCYFATYTILSEHNLTSQSIHPSRWLKSKELPSKFSK